MKTTLYITAKMSILIITLFLGFQIQLVMAKSPTSSGTAKSTSDISALAPVTPKEATFEDGVPEKAPSMVSIAPTPPKEASFEYDDSSHEISTELLKEVAPATPAEADFNDAAPDADKDRKALRFTTPGEASFSDF